MTPRILVPSVVLASALALSACASTSGQSRLNYQGELDKLTAECTARDGILTPIAGARTGQPQTEYACQIRGGASRIRDN